MIRLVLALALLATPAEAATAVDRMHCWAYPHHDRCKPPAQPPPAAPAEPVQAPVAPPPPVLAPAPPAPQASPEPLQAPLPTIAPVQLPATPAPPAAAPAPPRAAPARAAPVKKAKRQPEKMKAPPRSKWQSRPKRGSAANEPGPDLQWPCWAVRLNAGKKTCGELAAEGRRRGISLTRKQHYQAAVCLGRCFPPR